MALPPSTVGWPEVNNLHLISVSSLCSQLVAHQVSCKSTEEERLSVRAKHSGPFG